MESAVLEGDLHTVKYLIRTRRGSGVNARLPLSGSSLLMVAICASHKDIALALLAAGADVHAKDKTKGWTALHFACDRELEEVVQALIHRGSRVDEPSKYGETPLKLANGRSAMHLLRAGASCKGLSKVKLNTLFCHACSVGDLSNVRTLRKNGCSFSTLSRKDKEELLHCARREGDTLVAGTLLKNGCSVSTLSREEQEALLHCACHEGDTLLARTLLNSGCSLSTLSKEEQETLLHCACRDRDTLVAEILVKNGCSVTTLLREEQEDLLCCAYSENSIVLSQTLLKNGCTASRLRHTERLHLVEKVPKKEELLHCACMNSNVLVVEALLATGCNMNCADATGVTPLMNAADKGHEEVVKKLILAGANVGMQNSLGGTALHYAASPNHIQCGILLVEGGASTITKNKFSNTPLDVATVDFRGAVKQALSFVSRKTLCVIGNAEGGKSTLIASLKAESTGFLGRIVNHFKSVRDRRQRTAGIETVPHCSQRYGEVLFFDFAGQDDYHGPHQMFLESLLSKQGVTMTIIVVIKMTEEEDAISHQLHRWLSPVALMATPASPLHVIIIGSFLDKVKSKEEATAKLTKCIEANRRDLEEFPLKFDGFCFLNCRKPQSEGIDQLCAFLQDIPVPEFRATHTRYSLAWVLYQIRSSFMAQAVQLEEFSKWVQDNKDNLPLHMPPPEEVCQDLSAAGHALYLPKKEYPPKSWLVLDLPSILHDVYGTLFSKKEFVREFGLLQSCNLIKLFPNLDLTMIQQLLISLEFCIPVDPSVLKVDLSELTQSKETSGWLFFPALISTKHPQLTSDTFPEQSIHSLCWQLRTTKKHSISARLLQTILLRLAAHFVVKQRNKDGVLQHCCSVWCNGITWMSTAGVDVTVHIVNSRVIQVMATSTAANRLRQYLTDVISDILSAVNRLSPKVTFEAYIVHPPSMVILPKDIPAVPAKCLFPVEGIRDSIKDHNDFTFSLMDCRKQVERISVTELFQGHTPTLENIERVIWPQPAPPQPQYYGEIPSSKPQALLNISSTPTMRDMDELVVTPVAANWQKVALRLGVEGCVSEVVFKNHPNDCEGACQDMLDRWLRGDRHTGEEERTWLTLLTALGRAGFGELERRLRKGHFQKDT